jgi:hypothetical protein
MSVLAGHTHDLSEVGPVGWVLIGLAALFVVWVIWRTIVLTVRPGEEDPDHIKYMILDDDPAPDAGGQR